MLYPSKMVPFKAPDLLREYQEPATLAAIGRDVESQVLARAVKWHVENRVLLNGHRTVVFR